jgi:hypothetical protein
MVYSAQTVHPSCADINTISNGSKRASTWLMRVRAKWFPSLWYIRHKPCTYLVPRLTLSPNGLKQASTWHTLPWSTIGCAQSNFYASGTLITNHAPILQRIKTISKRIKMCFYLTHITKEYHRVRPKWFSSLWYVRRKPCTNLAPRLTLSPNGLKQASTWLHFLGLPSGVPKAISMPIIHSSQTVHLSCTGLKLSSNGSK